MEGKNIHVLLPHSIMVLLLSALTRRMSVRIETGATN
nr:MAG TPA: hypothetical protein [Caudoviricetes sp.]